MMQEASSLTLSFALATTVTFSNGYSAYLGFPSGDAGAIAFCSVVGFYTHLYLNKAVMSRCVCAQVMALLLVLMIMSCMHADSHCAIKLQINASNQPLCFQWLVFDAVSVKMYGSPSSTCAEI